MGRTVIVGDVHGCREELDALLDKVGFTAGDRLVFVGDLVARGPDSLGVLDIARRTGAVIVRGNHEEKLLGWYAAKTGKARGNRKKPDESLSKLHADLAHSLREVDWTLLSTSPLYFEMPEHGACVVHAGVVPGVRLEEQAWSTLISIRCLSIRGEALEEKGSRLWGASYVGPPHVVFGHNAMAEPQLHAWATGLDTSCVYGGRLTALVLGDGEKIPRGNKALEVMVSEPARKMHYDWSRKTAME